MKQLSISHCVAGISPLILLLIACEPAPTGPPDTSAPLATVHGDTVYVRDLTRIVERLPEHLRVAGEGEDAVREYLQILIDRLILTHEAEGSGLSSSAEVGAKVAEHVQGRLKEIVMERVVSQQITIAPNEVSEVYEELDMGWRLWPAHILSATQEEAWEIHRLLSEGADFAALAREHSLADDAPRGGELREWFDYSDAVPVIREAAFPLDPGQFTEPVETIDGFEVIKVLDKHRMTLPQMRSEVHRILQKTKWSERRQVILDSLTAAYGVGIDNDQIPLALTAVGAPTAMTPQQAEQTLVSWRGGRLTLGDFLNGVALGAIQFMFVTNAPARFAELIKLFKNAEALSNIDVNLGPSAGFARCFEGRLAHMPIPLARPGCDKGVRIIGREQIPALEIMGVGQQYIGELCRLINECRKGNLHVKLFKRLRHGVRIVTVHHRIGAADQ